MTKIKSQRLNLHKFGNKFQPKICIGKNIWAISQREWFHLAGRFLIDGLQHCSHLIAVDVNRNTSLIYHAGHLKWQVTEPTGSRYWGQGVNGKQPSTANVTKGEVSASRNGRRQDEAELGPFGVTSKEGMVKDV